MSHQSALTDAGGSVHFCCEPLQPAPGESSHYNLQQAKRGVECISSVFISHGSRWLGTIQDKCKFSTKSRIQKDLFSFPAHHMRCLYYVHWYLSMDICCGGGLLACKHIHSYTQNTHKTNKKKFTEFFCTTWKRWQFSIPGWLRFSLKSYLWEKKINKPSSKILCLTFSF